MSHRTLPSVLAAPLAAALSVLTALLLAGPASAQVLIDFTNLVDEPGNGELDGTEFRGQGLDMTTDPGETFNVGCGTGDSCLSSDLGVDDFSGTINGDFRTPGTLENAVVFAPFEIDLCCNVFTPEDTIIRIFDADDTLLAEAVDSDLVYNGLTPVSRFTVRFASDGMSSIEYEELQTQDPDLVVFLDPLFRNIDWSELEVVDTTPGGAGFFSAGLELTGGNPEAYRRVTHSHDIGTLAAGHFRGGATYSPAADGPISTVDTAFDAIHLNPAPGESVALAILLLQGGSFYATELVEVSDAVWTSFSDAGLVAADFTRVSGGGPATPDFSATGGSIQFGMLTSTTSSAGPQLRELGFDNWRVTLDRGSAPPEAPALAAGARALAAALLLAAGLACGRSAG